MDPLALPITELSQGKDNPSKRRNNLFHNLYNQITSQNMVAYIDEFHKHHAV